MSTSSEDEQDESEIFDQLKSIRAFTVDQLYLLHPDVGCPSSLSGKQTESTPDRYHDQNLYQNLIDYEQLRHKLYKLKTQVKYLNRKTFDHVDKVWYFKEEAVRKVGMCQQGKIAETTFKYKKAFVNSKQLNVFDLSFNELIELITKDFIYYSFESQMRRTKIGCQLTTSYKIADEETRNEKLKSVIATLLNFIKHLGDSKSDFVYQCRKWLRAIIVRFLETEDLENYKFVIGQLCKGPAGTADWSSDLIQYKPFGDLQEFKSSPRYITHCSILLSELFNNLKDRINRRRVTISTTNETTSLMATTESTSTEQNWSIIDPRFINCDEELPLNSSNTLTESDVIKFCLRIPVAQIFRAYVKKCLEPNKTEDDETEDSEQENNYEFIMLKLLTIGTVIIKTYQIGLESFNSIQYGNLIEYLSSQIRRTVIVLSDQWTEFKRRLKGIDNALLMRLQVEYDNFILRSILIILELRQSGIWRYLSRIEPDDLLSIANNTGWSTDSIGPTFAKLLQVTGLSTPTVSSHPERTQISETIATSSRNTDRKSSNSLTYEFSIEWFKEVSESMLWHILWQFYHNAFVSSCDYHSDNYWVAKFQENSVVYLFVNKIRDSPKGECTYLLNSITSMLLSRTRTDSKFVCFVATQLFDLSFKQHDLKNKITKTGTISLIRCAEKFPCLISLYISFLVDEETIDEDIVTLFKGCSLTSWLCDDDEFCVLASWLVESPLTSLHNKIARIVFTKLLLNGSETRLVNNSGNPLENRLQQTPLKTNRKSSRHQPVQCILDLSFRRRLALLLYESSARHMPEVNENGPQSLGTKVELAFSDLFSEESSDVQSNLIELSTSNNYQQFYVWIWRLLFTFRLHILNQPETDWNDVQSRSGTSRSIKNTVLFNDSFHPVPTIQDSECLSLSEGVKNQQPIASYVYLSMTDVTWQANTLNDCLIHLNSMAASGHLTPSLMCFKFLTICHLKDLNETMAKDQKCIDYLTAIINSNFDTTRLASLIITQIQNLKQYRQLQLSQFYITVLLEVAVIVINQLSSSWFSSDEHKLEKIACLLDHIIKFNFPTQSPEIIRKFYDCSYPGQSCKAPSGWVASFFTSTTLQSVNSTKREFITTLHLLTQRFKKYIWLRWITTECDTLRLEKIWEDIVQYLSANEESNIDSAMKKVCPHVNSNVLKSTIPIYSWLNQILDLVETDLNHPLCPLIWYNFFLNYFSNILNAGAVGLKLIPQEKLNKLLSRLDSLVNYHLYKQRNWSSLNTDNNLKQNSLAQLYRAYRLWLQDPSLQGAYVDMDRLKPEYLVPLLKTVMESSTQVACLQYIDIHGIETQNRNLSKVWLTATILESNNHLREMMFVVSGCAGDDNNDSIEFATSIDDEASDAVSLIVKPSTHNQPSEIKKPTISVDDDFKSNVNQTTRSDEQAKHNLQDDIEFIKTNCLIAFEESAMFNGNIQQLEKLKNEIIDLIGQLFTNKKIEHVRFAVCIDGPDCAGPARLKIEIEEATVDDRKRECIQDRERECDEIVQDLLIMPSQVVVKSTILIEEVLAKVINEYPNEKMVVEDILKWISQPNIYNQLNGSYHTTNHLLKSILDILSETSQVDTFNIALIDVCFDHPGSVQIFSPYLSPSACSSSCFLELYKKVCLNHNHLGPMALFVLLSKFDLNSWLKNNSTKEMLHSIIMATCGALGSMGKQPDESFNLTFDLYRRHIQFELALPDRRKPEEILLVMDHFLSMMDDQVLTPSLWMDFLSILGLDKQINKNNSVADNRSIISMSIRQQLNNSSIRNSPGKVNSSEQQFPYFQHIQEYDEDCQYNMSSIIEDVAKLADCQTLLDYNALDDMIVKLGKFLNDRNATLDVTLLELYHDYLEQFSIVMISITFMWLKAVGELYPDNHHLIWKKFMDLWYELVFLSKNCQNVGKSSYSLMSNQFVAAIRYMIYRIPDNTQMILKSTLENVNNYVKTTKEVVYLELTILQRCLKNLPWALLEASPEDFENMASLSEQENYNVSDLLSHILMQINTKDSLQNINQTEPSKLAHVAERLATTIVIQSSHLRGFRLYGGGYLASIPVDKVEIISKLIMSRMEFTNLEHNQNNKLLINILRFMCIKIETSINDNAFGDNYTHSQISDSFERSLIYANYVSDYLISLIKNHPNVTKFHKPYLYAVMDNSLQDLKILLSPDVDKLQKKAVYECLLNCCYSSDIDESSRILIARSLIRSNLLKNHPIVVMEVFNAVGQIIRDPRALVYIVEKMIMLYLNNNGHYEKVWKSFQLKVIPGDIYLEACISESVPLALLVYFEALFNNEGNDNQQVMTGSTYSASFLSNNEILSNFLHWLSRLQLKSYINGSNEIKSNEVRLSIAWLKLLDMMEGNLLKFLDCDKPPSTNNSTDLSILPIHRTLIDFTKQLISIYDSSNSSSLWSYLRFYRYHETNTRIGIIALSIACFFADRTINTLKGLLRNDDKFGDSDEYILESVKKQNQVKFKHLVALKEEVAKLRRSSLSKLEVARKAKSNQDSTQYIEAFIEAVNQNDKVQYSDGVQLITTFVKNLQTEICPDDCINCINKILP